jgi:hypothetical protein
MTDDMQRGALPGGATQMKWGEKASKEAWDMGSQGGAWRRGEKGSKEVPLGGDTKRECHG